MIGRYRGLWLLTAAVCATAHAADRPAFGPPPGWAKPVAVPVDNTATDEAAIRLLLADRQIAVEADKVTVYSALAMKIQTPQGLAAGNISFAWRPDTDVLTVHRLVVRRGGQTIDVLGSGQTFTVVRREQNLESATLDGVLTANIQPEGLQVGDVIEYAASIASSDPVMKGHAEQLAGVGFAIPVGRVHFRMQWPSTTAMRIRAAGGLPVLKPVKAGSLTTVELTLDDLQPGVAPKGAPPRYLLGRLIEASDFASWADLGTLLEPLYRKAAVLPADGPLRIELDRIKARSTDPATRTQDALALVQDRVRYVALAMGPGGLVPADAATTWSRRYGDCKAKTTLLLALLRAMDIQAEAVAVNTVAGDGIDARLPMVGQFNHVLVRAVIAGRTYWLDGTRSGDARLDRLRVPAFGWGLPLVATGAALVRLLPAPLTVPDAETSIRIDARQGITLPAPFTVETVLRGDNAVATNLTIASSTGAARDRMLREYWRGRYDFVDVTSATAAFDVATGELKLAMSGTARMEWRDGWYETDGTSLGYKADFVRDPGSDKTAPYLVSGPFFNRTTETILLPPDFPANQDTAKHNVDQAIAGVEYKRTARLADHVFRVEASERSIAAEFPASEAPAAEISLRALADGAVYVRKPTNYQATEGEVKQLVASNPTTAAGHFERGLALLNLSRFKDAIKAFDAANALDPKDASTLANRGLAYAGENDFTAATKDLEAAIAIDAGNRVALRVRGFVALQKEDHAGAVAAFTAALAADPGNEFALNGRMRANRALGKLDAALADGAAILKTSPQSTETYLLRANMLRTQGRKAEAAAEAAAMQAASPDSGYAQVAAGKMFAALGDNVRAAAAFDRAIAIKPEAYIYINRAQARKRADMAGRAADIDAALKLDPESADAIAMQAGLQVERKDDAGAIPTYTRAIKKFPGWAEALTRRGGAYLRTGRSDLAHADFAAARAAARDAEDRNTICWTKATGGFALGDALADCNAALDMQPDSPAFLDSRALVYLRLGRFDAALADYDRALAKAPTEPSSLYGRGITWSRKGDQAKADADIAAALKSSPDIADRFAGYGVTR